MSNIFVTSFIDLSSIEGTSRRDFSFYLDQGRHVLQYCKHVVMFTETKLFNQILDLRRGYYPNEIINYRKEGISEVSAGNNSFTILPTSLGDLPDNHLSERITQLRGNILNMNQLKDTTNFLLVQWAKFYFLKQVYDNSVSENITWIDFGITHVAQYPDLIAEFQFTDKIKLLSLRPTYLYEIDHPEFLKYFNGRTGGGVWGIPRDKFIIFYDLFHMTKQEVLDRGYAPLEDEIVTVIRIRNPHLFQLYYGDYCDIIRNFNNHIRCSDFTLFRMSIGYAITNDDFETISSMGCDLYNTEMCGRITLPPDARRYMYRDTIRALRRIGNSEKAEEIEKFSMN